MPHHLKPASLAHPARRRLLLAAALGPWPVWAQSALDPQGLAALQRGGAVLLMRHAQTTPGNGDPPGIDLARCETQRNLSDAGRAQARALGRQLAAAGIRFAHVYSSQWCRCMDTGELLTGRRPAHWAALDSVFYDTHLEPARSAEVRERVRRWRGPGNLALVTHRPNVLGLTGRATASGQALILVPDASATGFALWPLNG